MKFRLSLIGLVLFVNILITACATAVPPTPTPAPSPTITPTPTATATATITSTPRPTLTPRPRPTATATSPNPSVEITLVWEHALEDDADDIAALMIRLRLLPGVINGFGGEHDITITYDPTLVTVEQIRTLLSDLGYPTQKP